MNGHNPAITVSSTSTKACCRGAVPGGKSLGVSGYVVSRYFAIRADSETMAPVEESEMMGTE
jgi:hypothetical protein